VIEEENRKNALRKGKSFRGLALDDKVKRKPFHKVVQNQRSDQSQFGSTII